MSIVSSPTRPEVRRRRGGWALALAAAALLVAGPAEAGDRSVGGRRVSQVKPTTTRRPIPIQRTGGWLGAIAPANGRRPPRRDDSPEVKRARELAEAGRARAELHQFFTTNPAPVRGVLARLDLSRHTVIELGVGTGIITKEILRKNPVKVIGFEIEPELVGLADPRLEIVPSDFTKTDLSFLGRMRQGSSPVALIANPPYKQLPFIKREIIDRNNIRDVILMIPARRLKDFPAREGYRVVAELRRGDFSPPAAVDAPRHLLIARGFLSAKTNPRRTSGIPLPRGLDRR